MLFLYNRTFETCYRDNALAVRIMRLLSGQMNLLSGQMSFPSCLDSGWADGMVIRQEE